MFNLIRVSNNENKCCGQLYLNGRYICDTLENGKTLIPEGIYDVKVTKSPAFTKKRKETTYLPLLSNKNVPDTRGIRIHAGNKYTDSSGCVLVGESDGKGQLKTGSRNFETMLRILCETLSDKLIITNNF